jgi:hypothetical protein
MLSLLAECFVGQGTPYATQIKAEIDVLNRAEDSLLLHDALALINEPVFFHEFLQCAATHGLQYAAEAMPHTTALEQFPPQVRQVVERAVAGRSTAEREQLIDLLRRRVMRVAVLCRADVALDRSDAAAERAMRDLYVASSVRDGGDGSFVLPQGEVFAAPAGSAAEPLLRRIMALWPQSIAVGKLLEQSNDPAPLCRTLLQMARTGLLEVDAHPPACSNTIAARPLASPVARLQAADRDVVTHLRHDQVRLPPAAREVLLLADGSRTADQIAATRPDAAQLLADLARNALLVQSGP